LYGYYDKNDLRLTGVARYDGLISQPIRQILIIPTWRAYISMPVSIGNVRPYSETFKETDYFKIFNSLINNSQMIETAKRCNYKVIYVLHPTISSQIDDFTPGENVEVISPVNVNYEKVLTESDLMITDYSGVQFDFAYMRKPILYYHPDKLPPHYEEGGFYYDTMGFGEICSDEQHLVDSLCDYMEHECKIQPFYKDRADQFFAFSDTNNCKRIYDSILEMQKNK
jgi:CDP-glycerol glycerophosphotransferase (TagB/SpsB family)